MTTSNQQNQQSARPQPEFGLKRPDQVKIAPPAGERVPPGQFVAKTFPVLTYGDTPEIDLATWRIRVWGLVEKELELDWAQFCGLPWVEVNADFHCVTQWSALDQTWEGVWVADLLEQAGVRAMTRGTSWPTVSATILPTCRWNSRCRRGCWPTGRTARKSAKTTAGRCACSYPVVTVGSPPSG